MTNQEIEIMVEEIMRAQNLPYEEYIDEETREYYRQILKKESENGCC